MRLVRRRLLRIAELHVSSELHAAEIHVADELHAAEIRATDIRATCELHAPPSSSVLMSLHSPKQKVMLL
jgi:hypothetical protein